MFEHFRNELLVKLSKFFSTEELNVIGVVLDEVSDSYEFTEKTTELAVYNGGFPKLAEMFLQTKRLEGLSPNSERLYRGRLRIFFEVVQKSPENIDARDIRGFLAYYKKYGFSGKGVSNVTLDKFRQIIVEFYEWCVNEDYLIKNPSKNISDIKFVPNPRQALTRMQFEKLRRACKTPRELAIIDTLFSTGCRIAELSRMKKSEIDTEDKSIHIIGKGSKHNDAYFNINSQISLTEYIQTRNDNNDYLFVSLRKTKSNKGLSPERLRNIVKEIAGRVGLSCTPHVLRHTMATISLENGMPVEILQEILNHASIDTTMIYAKRSKKSIREAHLRFAV